MSFRSFHFLLFLAAVVSLNWILRGRPGWRKNVLLLASYYFYMAWDWRYTALLALMTVVNFCAGAAIAGTQNESLRKAWLAAALVVCLGVLAFFKCADFFQEELARLLKSIGLVPDTSTLTIFLPLGISFFTFQSVSYVLDVYRRHETVCNDLRDFALFVAFFPTVLAGPITRARQLLPQFSDLEAPLPRDMEHGLALILRGFIKKVAFADVLAVHLVSPAFADPAACSPLFLLLGLYAYTFEIYMDVSGYTDIARGSALMCGFGLPENFNRPYIATSVSNFWQRWHMSMSGFFRDYLYFGLGGSQRGNVYLNLMLTFLAIGIWHGVGWNFIAYGLVHGTAVCCERWRRGRRMARGLTALPASGLAWLFAVFLTFHLVVFSRVLFRSPDITSAWNYVQNLFCSTSTAFPVATHAMLTLLIAAALHWVFPNLGRVGLLGFERLPVAAQAVVLVLAIYAMLALSIGNAPFVYFQF